MIKIHFLPLISVILLTLPLFADVTVLTDVTLDKKLSATTTIKQENGKVLVSNYSLQNGVTPNAFKVSGGTPGQHLEVSIDVDDSSKHTQTHAYCGSEVLYGNSNAKLEVYFSSQHNGIVCDLFQK